MAFTIPELRAEIQTRIAALPTNFPFAMSLATATDKDDIKALVLSHVSNNLSVCNWQSAKEDYIGLATSNALVLTRNKNTGNLWALTAYRDTVPAIRALAARSNLTMNNQLRAVYAGYLVAFRALASPERTVLTSVAFPLDARMQTAIDASRTDGLPVVYIPQYLNSSTPTTPTHYTVSLELAAARDFIAARL